MAENISKRYIIDSSFILSYLLPNVHTEHIDRIFDLFGKGTIELIAPPLLLFEVLNGLRSAFFQKRINMRQVSIHMRDFLNLNIDILPVKYETILQLAINERLTVYDASYIWLARTHHIPLLTLDSALLKI